MKSELLGTQRARQLEAEVEQLQDALLVPLEHVVVHDGAVNMREAPSTAAAALGKLRPGDMVQGYPVGSWLFLDAEEVDYRLAPRTLSGQPVRSRPGVHGAWVLANGSHLGKGLLLAPSWASITVLQTSTEELDVWWPGIKGVEASYTVEWKAPKGADGSAPGREDHGRCECGHRTHVAINGVPCSSTLQLRLAADVPTWLDQKKKLKLFSPWRTVIETLDVADCNTEVTLRSHRVEFPREAAESFVKHVSSVRHEGQTVVNISTWSRHPTSEYIVQGSHAPEGSQSENLWLCNDCWYWYEISNTLIAQIGL